VQQQRFQQQRREREQRDGERKKPQERGQQGGGRGRGGFDFRRDQQRVRLGGCGVWPRGLGFSASRQRLILNYGCTFPLNPLFPSSPPLHPPRNA
jgi:hypothetical protein